MFDCKETSYLLLSSRAALYENKRQYVKAIILWDKAWIASTRSENKKWAESRSLLCMLQLRKNYKP